jgi:uncharacterized protein
MAHVKRWRLCLLILLIASACKEKKTTDIALDKIPDPMEHNAYVSNPDHLINNATEQLLNEQMRQLDQSGRAQVAIVVLQTIGEQVPKDVAHELFRRWKPGQKEKDNGLVVLLVNDQHRIEFETGYGLEGDLPDVVCYRIQQSEMLPSFKQNDLDGGMLKGMAAVINTLPPAAAATADEASDTAADANELIARVGSTAEGDSIPDVQTFSSEVVPEDSQESTDMRAGTEDYPPMEDLASNNGEQGDDMGVGTLIGYVFYAIFCTMFVIQTGSAKRRKNTLQLFTPNWAHKIWIYTAPFILVIVLVNFFDVVYRWWLLAILMYGNMLAYLCYRTLIIHGKAALLLKDADRRQQYDALYLATKDSWLSAIFFPLPFLIYSKWQSRRLKKLRYDPYICEDCQQVMTLLKKGQKQQLLEPKQLAEDKVGSVTYDVWRCKQCDDKKVLGYQCLDVDAEECPSCKAITLVPGKKKTIRRATSSREGEGIQHYNCKHCAYTKQEYYVIAKPSSGNSGSSGSSGSSSSSSSGSWGGGSSGGGGAGSSW